MSKHSKNQNAQPYLSNQEQTKLQYGTLKQRLGKDSLRRFDSCFLCLQTLISPLSCPKGHLACKECYYENIIAQKKEISRLTVLFERQQSQKAQEAQLELQSQKLQEIQDFEKLQSSVTLTPSNTSKSSDTTVSNPIKGDLTKINAYWIPENAPQAKASLIEKPGTDLYCTASKDKHVISLKRLIQVHFTESKNGNMSQKICPCCSKELTNSVTLTLLKQCGHVICGHCMEEFARKSRTCMVCDEKCKDKDMITIESEGTGYTSKGGVEGIKSRESFQ